jgi:hypothetical protein
MMPNSRQYRPLADAAGRGALALWLLLSVAGCDTTTIASDGGAPFVLNGRGDPVRANSPPGMELTLGGKRVLQAGGPSGLD